MSYIRREVNSILKKIKNGDLSKQKELFDFTFNYLKKIALDYAIIKSEWEDILLQAYIRVFKYIYTFNENKDGYNWLCKIVENTANDFNNRIEDTEPLENVEHVLTYVNDVNIEDNSDLEREIRKLPPRDEQIILLRFWGDYTLDEIATKLKMSKTNVFKRINIIIEQIKNNLEKE